MADKRTGDGEQLPWIKQYKVLGIAILQWHEKETSNELDGININRTATLKTTYIYIFFKYAI